MTDEKKHPPCQGTRRIKVPVEGGYILQPCSCAGKDTMIVLKMGQPKEGKDG